MNYVHSFSILVKFYKENQIENYKFENIINIVLVLSSSFLCILVVKFIFFNFKKRKKKLGFICHFT